MLTRNCCQLTFYKLRYELNSLDLYYGQATCNSDKCSALSNVCTNNNLNKINNNNASSFMLISNWTGHLYSTRDKHCYNHVIVMSKYETPSRCLPRPGDSEVCRPSATTVAIGHLNAMNLQVTSGQGLHLTTFQGHRIRRMSSWWRHWLLSVRVWKALCEKNEHNRGWC